MLLKQPASFTSPIWNLFTVDDDDEHFAICNICGASMPFLYPKHTGDPLTSGFMVPSHRGFKEHLKRGDQAHKKVYAEFLIQMAEKEAKQVNRNGKDILITRSRQKT